MGLDWTPDLCLITPSVLFFLVPKLKEMDKRLGPLVDEFKDLVYPPGYSPEGKASKRKQGKELWGRSDSKA